MTYGQAKNDFEIGILYIKDAEGNYSFIDWLPDDAEGKIDIAAKHWVGIASQSMLCFVADR